MKYSAEMKMNNYEKYCLAIKHCTIDLFKNAIYECFLQWPPNAVLLNRLGGCVHNATVTVG